VSLLKRRSLQAAIAAAFLVLAFLVWRPYNPPTLYRMTILPPHTHAWRLNDHGQVVGDLYENGHTHLFLWDRTHGVQDLGFPAMGCTINNAGQIAGTMRTDPNSDEAFLWEPAKSMTMLGTLGGKISRAFAMNNHGQIAGVSLDANDLLRTFLWDKETGMKELASPVGIRCIPHNISDAGQVLVKTVKRTASQDYEYSWLLLDPNGSKPLDPMPPDTLLFAINANSCMVAIEKPGYPTSHLLFRDGQKSWKRLSGLHSEVTPRLNDRNQIAYTEHVYSRWEPLRDRLPRWLVRPRTPAFEAESYLWDPVRGRIPLNRYLKGIEGFHVWDLNNNGCIVGTGEAEDGNPCSVLLEPIPERWSK
jgi:probable HAF family extracellular repeat protein